MDDVDVNKDIYVLECGHQTTCKKCWTDYLLDSVNNKECVNLPCPAYKCHVTIPEKVWQYFLKDKYPNQFKRYKRFCRENFIEVFTQFRTFLFSFFIKKNL